MYLVNSNLAKSNSLLTRTKIGVYPRVARVVGAATEGVHRGYGRRSGEAVRRSGEAQW